MGWGREMEESGGRKKREGEKASESTLEIGAVLHSQYHPIWRKGNGKDIDHSR